MRFLVKATSTVLREYEVEAKYIKEVKEKFYNGEYISDTLCDEFDIEIVKIVKDPRTIIKLKK